MEPLLYQSSQNHEADLASHYKGTPLKDLPTPCAILDASILRRNCALMLSTVSSLSIQFRAHIKTHKTVQATALQVGSSGPVRLVVSTVAEAEYITPWLRECMRDGREVSVLYGVPAAPSAVGRLAKVVKDVGAGNGTVAFMVDHPSTIENIARQRKLFPSEGGGIPIYIKIDTGYGRAGVTGSSNTLNLIREKLRDPSIKDDIKLLGLYSHLGHSYGFSTPHESLQGLLTEFESLQSIATSTFACFSQLTLSVGATPTATAAQMLVSPSSQFADEQARWTALKSSKYALELHAGVYPFLDMQQLATQARIADLTTSDIGLTVLAEVASIYTDRAAPEVLIAAGSLALGREPCKSYSGWGVLTPWSSLSSASGGGRGYFVPGDEGSKGWIVGRISQEHGILTYAGGDGGGERRELSIGEKVRIWPNHACVAGAGFGWYFVVDSEFDGGEKVQDIWVRCRGW